MGAVRARPEDAGGRHHAAAAHPGRLRARRARDRSGAARGAADLRHHRRRPDRRRTRRHHRRTGARHAAARLPQHRHPQGARRADRGRPARAGGLSRRSLGLCAALAGKLGVEVVLGQPVTECSADGVVYGGKQAGGQNHRSGPPACAPRPPPNGSARRPTAPAACRSSPISPCPAIPISSRSAIPSTIDGPDGKPVPGIAPAAKQQGRYVADTDQGAAARRNAGAVPLPARRQPGADRQAQGGDRFRPLQAARHDRVVDLGHRPHLLPDRPAQPAQRRDLLALDPRPRPARRAADHAGPAARWCGEAPTAVLLSAQKPFEAWRGASAAYLTSPASTRHRRSAGTPARREWSKPACNSRTDISTPPASSPRTDTSGE